MPNYSETGVAYGVIAVASLGDWIYDEIDGMDIIDAMQAVAPSAPPPLPVSPWFGRLAV